MGAVIAPVMRRMSREDRGEPRPRQLARGAARCDAAWPPMAGNDAARTALTPAQEARKKAALAACAAVIAEGIADACELFAEGGAEAVAEAAWLPGGPSKEELAARAARMFVLVTRSGEASP